MPMLQGYSKVVPMTVRVQTPWAQSVCWEHDHRYYYVKSQYYYMHNEQNSTMSTTKILNMLYSINECLKGPVSMKVMHHGLDI